MYISRKNLLSTIEAVAYVITTLKLWRIHVDIWQNQYNIVKLKNKQKLREFCTTKPALQQILKDIL